MMWLPLFLPFFCTSSKLSFKKNYIIVFFMPLFKSLTVELLGKDCWKGMRYAKRTLHA